MKFKKVLAGALTAALTAVCIIQPFSAADVSIGESDIDYTINGNSVTVNGYSGSAEEFVIPETIEGKPVRTVNIIYDNYKCKSMTIPSTVDRVYAGYGNWTAALGEIKVDEKNETYSAENGVLYDKEKTELVMYPAGKTDETYVMPDTVERIGDRGSYSPYMLQNEYMKEITFSKAFNKIERYFLQSLPKLESISVATGNTAYTSVDGVLFSKDMSELIKYPPKKAGTEYMVPEGVKTIWTRAFVSASNLASISFSDSVTYLNENAFYDCDSLTTVTLPANVEEVFGNMFFGCDNLAEIKLANGKDHKYLTIENGALYDKQMTKLMMYFTYNKGTKFEIPDGVKTVGKYAFAYTKNLTSVTIPDSVTTLEDTAFFSTNLLSIVIPNSVTKIGKDCFSCTVLTSIVIPDSVTEIGNMCFMSCKSLNSVKIGSGLKKLPIQWVSHTNLTEVVIPGTVEEIAYSAFNCCDKLEKVVISDGVSFIGGYAFDNCTALKSVTIPASVTCIGTNETNEREIFRGCPADLVVYGVPGSYVEGYCKRFGYIFNEINTIVDEKTGISVMGGSDALAEGTKLEVEALGTENGMVSYDITLVDKDGKPVQPAEGTTVTVRIPVPAGMTAEKCRIYHAVTDEKGNVTYTSMNPTVVTVEGVKYLEFTTDHFSEYVVTEKDLTAPKGKLGDVFKDDKIDIKDARKLLQAVSGNIELTDEEEAVADVFADGNIDIRDARMLLQAASGSIEL